VTGGFKAEGLRKPSVRRIVRLALLTPDIVEGILAGRKLMLERLETLPANWEEQRAPRQRIDGDSLI
jgi:hypothetical protein